MTTNPLSLLVPSAPLAASRGPLSPLPDSCSIPLLALDIDLSWHTHQVRFLRFRPNPSEPKLTPFQLNFGRYREQVLLSQGTFVDHDDRIEEGYLHNGFSNTESLWVGTSSPACACPRHAPRLILVPYSQLASVYRTLSADACVSIRSLSSDVRLTICLSLGLP